MVVPDIADTAVTAEASRGVLRVTTAQTALVISAEHYEIVRIRRYTFGDLSSPLHPFTDVFVSADGGIARFVAGYLSFEWRAADPQQIAFFSHGVRAGALDVQEHSDWPFTVHSLSPFDAAEYARDEAQFWTADTGVGIALPSAASVTPEGDGSVLRTKAADMVMVHGPSAAKLQARYRQSLSLRAHAEARAT